MDRGGHEQHVERHLEVEERRPQSMLGEVAPDERAGSESQGPDSAKRHYEQGGTVVGCGPGNDNGDEENSGQEQAAYVKAAQDPALVERHRFFARFSRDLPLPSKLGACKLSGGGGSVNADICYVHCALRTECALGTLRALGD